MSTAYVFNGFKDLSLPYAGLQFKFPVNKVTQLGDRVFTAPDETRQNHMSNPEEGAMFETRRDGIEFAMDLMNRHYQGYQTEGVVWIGDHLPGPKEMQKAQELGRIKKLRMVEQAVADHRVAQNAGKYHDIDAEIVSWMVEYGITDAIYNQPVDGALSDKELAKISAVAAAVVAQMTAMSKGVEPAKQPEAVSK